MNNLPLRIGLLVRSDDAKVDGFYVIPRGRDTARSIGKCKEIINSQEM